MPGDAPATASARGVLGYAKSLNPTFANFNVLTPRVRKRLLKLKKVKDELARRDKAVTAATPGEWAFNIGTGRTSTPRDFLNAAAKMFPRHQIELGPGPSKLGRSKQSFCVFDISAARKHLGYEPAYSVQEGVRDYVANLDRLGR